MMTFLFPQALFLLLLVPLLAMAYIAMQRRRRRYALRYASLSLVRDAVGRGPGVRRHVPPALFLFAVAAASLALARPEVTMAVRQDRGIVMLSVDVSGSMAATDVKPDRMGALRNAVGAFVQQQPEGVEVGLVSFNSVATLLQPPTQDKAAVLQAIDRLQAGGGTNIGDGLRVALNAVQRSGDSGSSSQTSAGAVERAGSRPSTATIVLVSDGGSNTGPPAADVARDAAAAGVKVYTVGIGTAAGTVLRVQGQSVFTRLDEPTLQGIADVTGGRYLNAQTGNQLTQVYSDLAREQHVEDKPVEVTFVAAAGALALMLASSVLSLLWFNRLP